MAGRFRPQWILLDIGLPGIDGHEVCRRLRQSPSGKEVRMIAITGWGRAEDLAQSRAAGFDFHLVKPVDLEVLDRILAGGLGDQPADLLQAARR
jgi:CheY-like chemotaxis protein